MPQTTDYSYVGQTTTQEFQNELWTPSTYSTSKQMWKEVSRTCTRPERRVKPQGWLYPTDYHLDLTQTTHFTGSVHYLDKRYYDRTRTNGAFGGTVDGSVPFQGPRIFIGAWPGISGMQSLRDRAVTTALLNLKDQKLDLAVAFAERKATADMLNSAVFTLGKAARLIFQRKFRQAARLLKTQVPRKQPGNWLAWRYGWTPFLSDIHNSVSLLQDIGKDPNNWIVTVKGIHREPYELINYVNGSIDGTSTTSHFRWFREESGQRGAFVRLDYIPDDYILMALSSLGLTNPMALGYEMTRLSFVVDWLVPIGDWLKTLDAALGYQFLSGSVTERIEAKVRGRSDPVDNANFMALSGTSFQGSMRRLYLKRVPYTSSPLPYPPRLRNGLNLSRFADGISLLTQFIR